MARLLALVGALILAALIASAGLQAPKPQPMHAPAAAFSAERAMGDVRGVASTPHPLGSAADRAARDYLIGRMNALGLSPEVRRGVGVHQPKTAPDAMSGGAVENLVGVLAGRDRSLPALALMAHYDSVPGSPGASDDAAGVSAALEIVRAIRARGQPTRDVMVLLTDGEEAGLLGAHAFFERDPLARRVGFVINMESRGSAGRVQMFQTGERNDGAVSLLQAKAPRIVASSLTGFIYARMPNDTDFSISRQAGLPGLNFAFIGRQFDYHSPSSTPATQDPGTLQDLGDQVLPVAAAIAGSPTLPAQTTDLVYGQTPGGFTLAYPPAMGWAILAAAAALIAVGLVRARRGEPFPWLDLLRGAGGLLFALSTGAVLLHLAREATGVAPGFLEQRFLLAQAPVWETALFLLGVGALLMAASELARGRRAVAVVPLAAAVASCILGGLDIAALVEGGLGTLLALALYGRPASRPGAWTGVLLLGLVFGVAAQAAAPLAAYVLIWPLVLAATAAALTAAGADRRPIAIVLLAAAAAIGLAFAGDLAHASFLSLDLPELLVLGLMVAALGVWPLAQPDEGAKLARLLGPALLLAGLAVTLVVRFNDPYDARHPQATSLVYDIDQNARKAWRVNRAPEANAWTRAVLTADGGAIGKRQLAGRQVDAAPAPYIDAPPPHMTFTRTADGRLTLHVTPPAGARTVVLLLSSSVPAMVEQAGGAPASLALKPGKPGRVQWVAGPEGFDLVIRPQGSGRLDAHYMAIVEQWPRQAKPLPPPPARVMFFDYSPATILEGTRRFSW